MDCSSARDWLLQSATPADPSDVPATVADHAVPVPRVANWFMPSIDLEQQCRDIRCRRVRTLAAMRSCPTLPTGRRHPSSGMNPDARWQNPHARAHPAVGGGRGRAAGSRRVRVVRPAAE